MSLVPLDRAHCDKCQNGNDEVLGCHSVLQWNTGYKQEDPPYNSEAR